jgi:hypothetical protein
LPPPPLLEKPKKFEEIPDLAKLWTEGSDQFKIGGAMVPYEDLGKHYIGTCHWKAMKQNFGSMKKLIAHYRTFANTAGYLAYWSKLKIASPYAGYKYLQQQIKHSKLNFVDRINRALDASGSNLKDHYDLKYDIPVDENGTLCITTTLNGNVLDGIIFAIGRRGVPEGFELTTSDEGLMRPTSE